MMENQQSIDRNQSNVQDNQPQIPLDNPTNSTNEENIAPG